MGYEDEFDEFDIDEVFPDGIEHISDDLIRETHELGEGVVSERIIGSDTEKFTETAPEIVGEPVEDMEHWHLQSEDRSCAVACQEFMAEELLGTDLDESKMIDYAEKKGWYEEGTYPEDAGKLLEGMGLEVEKRFDGTLEDLQETLESGGKVMVSVNNAVLAGSESPYAGLGANHMVEVIGVDYRNPNDTRVILNDPGIEEGRGIEHSLNEFENAWEKGGCFMVSAYKV